MLVAVGVVATSAGVFATMRGCELRSAENSRLAAQRASVLAAVEGAQAAFAGLAMTPMSDLGEAMRVRQVLDACPVPTDARLAHEARLLLESAAEVLARRFGQDDPEVYAAWRDSAGYRLRDAESLRRSGVDADYALFVTGARVSVSEGAARATSDSPGAEADPRAKFAGLWRAIGALPIARASMPVAMATESAGMAVAFGEVVASEGSQESAYPRLEGALAHELWAGKAQAGARAWWTPPAGGLKSFLATHGRARLGAVGVIVESREAGRFPLSLSFYQDERGRWWLWRLNVHNVDPSSIVQIDY